MMPNSFFIVMLILCVVLGGLCVYAALYEANYFKNNKKSMRTRISIKSFYKNVKN